MYGVIESKHEGAEALAKQPEITIALADLFLPDKDLGVGDLLLVWGRFNPVAFDVVERVGDTVRATRSKHQVLCVDWTRIGQAYSFLTDAEPRDFEPLLQVGDEVWVYGDTDPDRGEVTETHFEKRRPMIRVRLINPDW